MKNKLIVFLFILLAVPHVSFARVMFTEIAWMGTAASQFGEWVELFNDGDSEVDLKGAVLYEGGGSTAVITLTKKISPKGYYLIERTTASSPDPLPGINDDAGSFGGSGFSNSGESLVLKTSDGTILDEVNATGGWPAGDASTKQTMQWNGTVWVTADPTPGAALPAGAGTVPGTPSEGSSGSGGSSTSTSSLSSHAGPVPIAPILKPREPLSVQAGRDRLGFVGVPLFFQAKAFIGEDSLVRDPAFVWSFGDGGRGTGAAIEHAYQIPGEYVVVLNGMRGEDASAARTRVKIIVPELAITKVEQGARPFIEITNKTASEVNLWKAVLQAGHVQFEFPEDTIILPGAQVSFSKEITGLEPKPGDEVVLRWPGGRVGSALTLRDPEQPRVENIADLEKTVEILKSKVVS